ncbi:uncharacterized protein si:ch211-122l24.6 isoform X3 [Pseudorasbora parva]|uniref:uncharacterized protein si:ch211-122l24.6 isoform X3 n=1 Tax=Pseudorasbora parva TaxID=51549 RepID=UPI00351DE2A1
MGSFFSSSLTVPPFIFDLPESKVKDDEEEKVDVFAALHEENFKMCETMYRQNARSKMEESRFNVYRRNWSEVVQKLEEKYPQWTSEDITNLRFHFEFAVDNYKYLLHFCILNELLDFFQDDTSPRRRRAMFDTVDTHKYEAINFEEYLQLMSTMNIKKPVTRPAGFDKDKDEMLTLCADISETHPFKQMCYGLF